MRHIRRVLVIGLAVVFLIALVIGAGVIFSVRNVNVTYIDYSSKYSSDSENEYEDCKKKLAEIKGSSLLFLKDRDIEEKIIYSQFIAVESYEKVYPCTVNVVLKERVECFAVKALNGYSIYDEDGKFIRSDNKPLNAIDDCPDVILDAKEKDVKSIAKLCAVFKENFGSVRRQLESVSAQSFFGMEIAEFKLRSGLTISVSEWQDSGELKIKKAYDCYDGLTDSQKASGTITVVSGKNGASATAKYDAD